MHQNPVLITKPLYNKVKKNLSGACYLSSKREIRCFIEMENFRGGGESY